MTCPEDLNTRIPEHLQALHQVCQATMRYPFTVWRFGEAIAVDGLLDAAEWSDDKSLLPFVDALFARWLNKERLEPADHVTPGSALLRREAALGGGRQCWESLVQLYAESSCAANGVPLHRPDLAGLEQQIWVDCLYTELPFLAQVARQESGPVAEQAASLAYSLLERYAAVLRNPATGLFAHGWNAGKDESDSIAWGRGNGWALLGMLDAYPACADTPLRPLLDRFLPPLLDRLLSLEIVPGRWRTILDDADAPEEVSLSAFYATGFRIAARLGFSPKNKLHAAADRALGAALSHLDAEGNLQGVSEATPAGGREIYVTRRSGTFLWGQGALLRALTEQLRASRCE